MQHSYETKPALRTLRASYSSGWAYAPEPPDPIGMLFVLISLVILAYIVGAFLTS